MRAAILAALYLRMTGCAPAREARERSLPSQSSKALHEVEVFRMRLELRQDGVHDQHGVGRVSSDEHAGSQGRSVSVLGPGLDRKLRI